MRHALTRSRGVFLVLAAITFTLAVPRAHADDADFAAVKKLFAKQDLIALQKLTGQHLHKVTALTPDQINQIAVLASQNLEIHSYLKGVKYDKFWDLLITPGHDKIRDRWGVNVACMDLLRRLGEKRLITDEAVVPNLIAALKHPYTETKRYAYYCLRDLTFRDVGGEVWGRGIDDARLEPKLLAWWDKWWHANQKKETIIDAMLEKQLRQRVEQTTKLIFTQLGGKHPGLMKSHMPTYLGPIGARLPYLKYEPGMMAFIDQPKVEWKELPALKVAASFITAGPDTEGKEKLYVPGPNKQIKVVYDEAVGNTDVAIRVFVTTPNQQLEQDLIQLLKKPPA